MKNLNEETAKRRAATLKDKVISGWKIGEYISSGKTAFVCQATKDKKAAIKIFETEFLTKKEIEELEVRLERQLSLVDLPKHPHLVEIYDSGYSGQYECYFLVMEFVDAQPLTNEIKHLPATNIGPLISQIASAAKYLEDLNLVHRDIKPDNIVISSDYSNVVLLDLGVIRSWEDVGGITDSSKYRYFIGTLRYSPPEFLLRNEENTKEGWRAVTFYQIGAVLHDMIMRIPIFEECCEPYPRLVKAIEECIPPIHSIDVDPSLVNLARICLLKDPNKRLKLLGWDNFCYPRTELTRLEEIKNRMKDRKQISLANHLEAEDVINLRERELIIFNTKQLITKSIRSICIGSEYFPRITVSDTGENEGFDGLLQINFSSSTTHSLRFDLIIEVSLSLIDQSAKIIQLNYKGFLNTGLEFDQSLSCPSQFYMGLIEEKELYSNLEELLYMILEQAQLKCDDEELVTSEPWINFRPKEDLIVE